MNSSLKAVLKSGECVRAQKIRLLGAALGALLICLPASPQGSEGRILGSITDQTGGVIAGASVTITDVQRGIARALVTDQAGEYNAPNLIPGTYTVRAEATGFKVIERQNILLEVGTEVRVDLTLQPGEQSQTVSVTETLPMVETANATLGGTLSNETINDLPLNGRNYQNLLAMRPGVYAEAGGGTWTQSTNGVRPEDNVYLVGGMYNVGAFSALSILNAPALAGDAASILPIDAIQEFNVEENPKAEFGWKPGAIVNVGIKSGANAVHGTAYAFGRDTSFDARNFFDEPGQPSCPAPCAKTGVALEQYGGTVGGPIKKDKIFFFGGYEGQRYTVGSPFQATVPASVPISGGNPALSIPDAEAALNAQCPGATFCTGNTANLSPLSLHLLNTIFPTTTNTNATISANFPSNFASDNWVAKFDLHINDKNTLNAMYFIANSKVNDEDAVYLQPQFLTIQTQRPQVLNGAWTYTPNSRWVNEAQFGAQHLLKPSFVGDHTVNPTTYGLNTGVTTPLYFGMPQISITGGGTSFSTLGGGSWPKIQGPETDFIAQDHVSYLLGNHSFKFGADFVNDNFTGGALNGVRGSVRFGAGTAFGAATALEDFLLGDPNQGKLLEGNALRSVYNSGFALFAQDDWRVRPRLMVNLGLRYEINTVMKEKNNLLGNFLPATGLVQAGGAVASPYDGDHNNFAPRLGLAWDIFGDGKTVFRAGGSIVYEQISYDVFLAYSNALGLGTVPTGAIIGPGGQTAGGTIAVGSFTFPAAGVNWNGSSVGGATIFPTGAVNCTRLVNIANVKGTPCNTVAIDPHLETPYVTTWTAEIQRSITNSLSLEVGYVGDHGSKLLGFRDINQADPNSAAENAAGNMFNASGNLIACNHCDQAGRPFNLQYPYLAFIYQLSNQDLSNYDGLQATLTQRASHGLSFTAGYTFAHALDDASSNFGGGLPQNSNAPGLEYSNSNFDIRNRFTFTTTYSIPGRKGFAQMLEGWQLNSIVVAHSGAPWSAVDSSSNVSGTGENVDRWDFFGKASDFTPALNPGIPFYAGTAKVGGVTVFNPTMPSNCITNATAIGTYSAATPLAGNLAALGCFTEGNSVLIAPPSNTFGTTPRNFFRGPAFVNWDLSVTKQWALRELLKAQFRAEFFNILNRPDFATPGINGAGFNNPNGSNFGCLCETADTAASNPVLGSGGSRAIQLGLKLIF